MKRRKLKLRQEMFCRYYIGVDIGNATRAYARAYNHDLTIKKEYRVAQASASRLLSNVIISSRIDELLNESGLTDTLVDKHHLFLVSQFNDLRTKMRAIEHYDKIKGRIKCNMKAKKIYGYERALEELDITNR